MDNYANKTARSNNIANDYRILLNSILRIGVKASKTFR